ncbi:MAG: hypothetical protein ABSE16_11650 [Verrucomicrobiota bacterium]|jgi:hypothetical protein
MTGNGKIAPLPRALRAELNRRMDDGQTGTHLVHWLNQRQEREDAEERPRLTKPRSNVC